MKLTSRQANDLAVEDLKNAARNRKQVFHDTIRGSSWLTNQTLPRVDSPMCCGEDEL